MIISKPITGKWHPRFAKDFANKNSRTFSWQISRLFLGHDSFAGFPFNRHLGKSFRRFGGWEDYFGLFRNGFSNPRNGEMILPNADWRKTLQRNRDQGKVGKSARKNPGILVRKILCKTRMSFPRYRFWNGFYRWLSNDFPTSGEMIFQMFLR